MQIALLVKYLWAISFDYIWWKRNFCNAWGCICILCNVDQHKSTLTSNQQFNPQCIWTTRKYHFSYPFPCQLQCIILQCNINFTSTRTYHNWISSMNAYECNDMSLACICIKVWSCVPWYYTGTFTSIGSRHNFKSTSE